MKIVIDGNTVEVPSGTSFTTDNTLQMSPESVLSVATPVKPLTQVEYDALPEAEKQAEAVYLVDEPPWTAVPLSIQEYDTEDGWHVRKWSDGYVEQTLTAVFIPSGYSPVLTAAVGTINAITLPDELSSAFPIPLTKKYYETINVDDFAENGENKTLCTSFFVNKRTGSLERPNRYLLALFNDGQIMVKYTISVCVTGRWK